MDQDVRELPGVKLYYTFLRAGEILHTRVANHLSDILAFVLLADHIIIPPADLIILG